jgi:hypothetical protein
MALTKPKLSQNIDTDISVFTDPILVLHQGSSLANVDTGFLFNRANGLVSNVAVYWSESANSFVTAFTTSSGAPDANISITTYANLRTGTVTSNSITNSGTLVIGNTGDVSANIGAYQTYANANVVAIQANLGAYQTYANANVVAIQANLGAFQVFSNANAATQAISINSIVTNANANTAAYLLTATGNINAGNITTSGTSGNISGVNYIFAGNYAYSNGVSIFSGTYSNTNVEAYIGGNIGAFQIFSNANAATQATSINTINANIGAYQTYANANVVVIQANLGSYQTYSNANVAAIQANIGAFYNYANTKIGTNTDSNLVINSTAESYGTTSGALVVKGGAGIAGNLWVSGNIYVANLISVASSTLSVQDPLLYLTASSLSPYNYDIGFYSQFVGGSLNNYQHTGFSRDVNTSTWTLFSNVFAEPGITINWTEANIVFDPIKVGSANIANTTISTSTTTGALVVGGGIGIAGNVYADALRTTTGIYWSGNGNPIAGITYTASASSPAGPSKGDQWYDTVSDILYEYIFDGTSSYWVDIQTSVIAANATVASPDAFYAYANTKIGTNTNSNLVVVATTSSTSNTTGALVVGGGVGVAGNVNIGGNASITSNLIVSQSGLFRGPYDESSTLSGVFVGNTGTGTSITPRIGFFNGNVSQNWQIDNNVGEFRFFVPGSSKMSLYPNGNLSVAGGYSVLGKQAVNGPAFRAYIAAGQTITSGSQQKVTFGTETFDTNNNFASSTFTPTVEGYYQLNATVRISGSSGLGEVMLTIWKNGSEYARGTNEQGTEQGNNFYSMQVSDLAYANGTTDYFEIYIQQTTGGNRDTTAGQNISYFSGCMVRGA